MKQKILVLFSHIDDKVVPLLDGSGNINLRDAIKKGIANWIEFLGDDPGMNGFTKEVTYAVVDTIFRTLHGFSNDGSYIIYADPQQIVEEGEKSELSLKTDYDLVCLVYNDNFVDGDKPNHPIDNLVYQYGFNVISIPLSWFSTLNDPSRPLMVDIFGVTLFFSHEEDHADFFLINTKTGANLHDKTHDVQNNNQQHPNDTYGFRDYLKELKPYWRQLASTQGDRMLVFFQVKGSKTVWALMDGEWVGYTDEKAWTSYIDSRPFSLIQVDQVEFDKLHSNPDVFKT